MVSTEQPKIKAEGSWERTASPSYQLGGRGSAVSAPPAQRGTGRSPGRKRILGIEEPRNG